MRPATRNSINDLAATITIAKEGYPTMAVAGAYAGPMFNVLAGGARGRRSGFAGAALSATTYRGRPRAPPPPPSLPHTAPASAIVTHPPPPPTT